MESDEGLWKYLAYGYLWSDGNHGGTLMEMKNRNHSLQKKILVAIELCNNALGSFQEVFNIFHGGLSKLALWEMHINKIVYISWSSFISEYNLNFILWG